MTIETAIKIIKQQIPEMSLFLDNVYSIPAPKKGELMQWIYNYSDHGSQEAYEQIIKHYLKKALVIALVLSIKNDMDLETTIEETIYLLIEIIYNDQYNIRNLSYIPRKLKTGMENLIKEDRKRFSVTEHSESIHTASSRIELAKYLHVTEWDLQKYYDFQPENQEQDQLLEVYRNINPYIYTVNQSYGNEISPIVTHFQKTFLALSSREQFVLIHRYGLLNEEATLQSIGYPMGVSRERIRQIQETAIRKIKITLSRPLKHEYGIEEAFEIENKYLETIQTFDKSKVKTHSSKRQESVTSKERIQVRNQKSTEKYYAEKIIIDWLKQNKGMHSTDKIWASCSYKLGKKIKRNQLPALMYDLWYEKKISKSIVYNYNIHNNVLLYYIKDTKHSEASISTKKMTQREKQVFDNDINKKPLKTDRVQLSDSILSIKEISEEIKRVLNATDICLNPGSIQRRSSILSNIDIRHIIEIIGTLYQNGEIIKVTNEKQDYEALFSKKKHERTNQANPSVYYHSEPVKKDITISEPLYNAKTYSGVCAITNDVKMQKTGKLPDMMKEAIKSKIMHPDSKEKNKIYNETNLKKTLLTTLSTHPEYLSLSELYTLQPDLAKYKRSMIITALLDLADKLIIQREIKKNEKNIMVAKYKINK